MKKYDSFYLEYNNISEDFHQKQLEMVEQSIHNAFNISKVHCLHMYVTDMTVMEAILPALSNYSFKLNKTDNINGYRLLEVYK